MSMLEKIGQWYDARDNEVLPGRDRLIQVSFSPAHLQYAEDVLYGEGGRLAKVGAVAPPVAKVAVLGVAQTPEM